MAITYFGRAANIADNGSEDDSVARAITPPASMVTGDLVIVRAVDRNSSEVMTVSATGGQTWTSELPETVGSPAMRCFWCRYNGTWGTNPSFQSSNMLGSALIVEMLVFRPTTGSNTWATDVAQVIGHTTSPASPFDSTVSSQTSIATSTVTVASWGIGDDRACALQTAGWTNPSGVTQLRNLAGNDATLSNAYKIQSAPGATGTVTNRQTTSGLTTQWLVQTWKEVAGAGITVTDVDTDEIVTATQANVVITGTSFGASQGAGSVKLIDGSQVTTLSVDSWADTSIQVDMSLGGVRYGVRTLRVTNGSLASADISITVNPPSGRAVYDLTTLRPLTFDSRNKPSRRYSSPDLTNNCQLECSDAMFQDLDGRVSWGAATLTDDWRWHNGTSWSPLYSWDLTGLAKRFPGPPINNISVQNGVAILSILTAHRFDDEEPSPGEYQLIGPSVGLVIDAVTGIITGTPTVDGTHVFKVLWAGDDEPDAESNSFSVQVSPAPIRPSFSGQYANAVATVNLAIEPIEAAVGWTLATSYLLSGAPPGVQIDQQTGRITGAPLVTGTFTAVVTGVNAVGPAIGPPSFTFTVEAAEVEDGTIPNLVGLTRTDAEAALTAAQFTLGTTTSANSARPLDEVLSQNPAALTLAPLGTVVSFVVASGSVAVPDLEGQLLADALALITSSGLIVGLQTEAFNERFAKGLITAQSPAKATSVLLGTGVDITVSLGAPPFVPPAVAPKSRRTISLRKFLITG